MFPVLLRSSVWLLAAGLGLGLATTAVAQPDAEPPGLPEATRLINDEIAHFLASNKENGGWKAGPRCSDHEFIRRATLDIIGRIATVEEIERYLEDAAPRRRELLIERLIASPAFAEHWASLWTNWLLGRHGESSRREPLRKWLKEENFARNKVSLKDMAERLIAATGKASDNPAAHFMLANLGEIVPPGKDGDGRKREGQFEMLPATAQTIRVFHGIRFGCIQCHDNYFNAESRQRHFWAVNRYFRQADVIDGLLTDNPAFNARGIILFQNYRGVFRPSGRTYLGEINLPPDGKRTRRRDLAEFLTDHKQFSRTQVHLVWSQFFGRGFTENPKLDDFGDHNPVVHDKLLDGLATRFTTASHDPRPLIRWICLSDVYQRTAAANRTNQLVHEEFAFSRQIVRPMSPEQLFDSVWTAVGHSPRDRTARRDAWTRLLTVRADSSDEGIDETSQVATLNQVLTTLHGPEMRQALAVRGGTLDAAMKREGKAAINFLYLATLNRPATDRELEQIAAQLKDADRREGLEDLLWSLLNCGEFALNH